MMKRLVPLFPVCAFALFLALPVPTSADTVVIRPVPPRGPVVVHPGWPIRRTPRHVVVRPPRVVVRVPPARYLPVVTFRPVVVSARRAPGRDVLAWEDTEILTRREEWTEFTLTANSRGRKLWLEVREGRARIDWAEVVFENGEVQVVDFKGGAVDPGFYTLLDFRDGRQVDHVRMVARAATNRVRLTLRMEK